MPALPTVEVTEEQYDLIWSKLAGETDEEKAAAFHEWLMWQVQFYVTGCVRRDNLYLGEGAMIAAVEAAAAVFTPPPAQDEEPAEDPQP